MSEVKYLEHIISEVILVDPDKISCVNDLPSPKIVSEVKHIVGFTSFHGFYSSFAHSNTGRYSQPNQD